MKFLVQGTDIKNQNTFQVDLTFSFSIYEVSLPIHSTPLKKNLRIYAIPVMLYRLSQILNVIRRLQFTKFDI